MRVFIGSSSQVLLKNKQRPLSASNIDPNSVAVLVAKTLRDLGLEVKAWWEPETIPHQRDFFKQIQHWARVCDLGVFILSRSDKLSAKAGDATHMTKGNVILEMGMFMQSLGEESVHAIPEKRTPLMSDLMHKNWHRYDFRTERALLLQGLKQWLATHQHRSERKYMEHQLFVNEGLHDTVMNDGQVACMGTKALYLGRAAAIQWKRIESDPNYLGKGFKAMLSRFVATNCSKPVDNVISLGPGIGVLDEVVLRKLSKPAPRFIPIDINPQLAMEALKRLSVNDLSSGPPTAIIDDFESHLKDLKHLVKTRFNDEHHRTLFIMMGGTFGNLDNPELLLESIATWMDDGDRLLLDVFLRATGYTLEGDLGERRKLDGFSDILVNAVRLRARVTSSYGSGSTYSEFRKLSFPEQKLKLWDYVEMAEVDMAESSNPPLPNHEADPVILFRLKAPADELIGLDPVLLKMKRYEEPPLLKIFEQAGLSACATSELITVVDQVLLKRVYLLQRAPSKPA